MLPGISLGKHYCTCLREAWHRATIESCPERVKPTPVPQTGDIVRFVLDGSSIRMIQSCVKSFLLMGSTLAFPSNLIEEYIDNFTLSFRRAQLACIPRRQRRHAHDGNYKVRARRVRNNDVGARPGKRVARDSGVVNCYRYTGLPPRHIRLLYIQPGGSDEPVRCSTSVHSLDENEDEAAKFEALSYTWGDQRNCQEIFLDRKSFQAGRNLWGALKQLRYPDRTRTMWIDALCINQADLGERAEQVQLMDRIYRQATSVVIWLGAASRTSPVAFDLIRKLYSVADATPTSDVDKPFTYDDLKENGLPEKYHQDWDAFDALLWRDWFKRVWIIQEVTFATAATFMCGEDRMPFETFAVVVNFFERRQLSALVGFNASVLLPLLGQQGVVNNHKHGIDLRLLSLLCIFKSSLATNPVDKVYALLNLGVGVTMTPNYEVSTADVFRDVCTQCIKKSLEILSYCDDPYWKEMDDLPSWVPDWSTSSKPESPLLQLSHSGNVLNAGGETDVSTRLSNDGLTVFIHGILLHRVETTADPLIYGSGSSIRLIPSLGPQLMDETKSRVIGQILRSWERIILKLKRYPTGEDIREVLYQTLIANRGLGPWPGSDPPGMEEIYSCWRRAYLEPSSRDELNQRDSMAASIYNIAMWRACHGRRLFVTQSGYVGLSSFSTRRRDCVVVFNGGRTAYVLRDKKTKEGKRFKFIGEAYLHGFMNGEAFQNVSEGTAEDFAII